MAGTLMQTVPSAGKRIIVVGLVGLFVGGLAGGLGSWLMRHGTGQSTQTATSSASLFSPEAVRARSALRASLQTHVFSPEAIRQYVRPTYTELFSPEAIRAQSYVAPASTELFSPEGMRQYVPPAYTELFSPERLRAQIGN